MQTFALSPNQAAEAMMKIIVRIQIQDRIYVFTCQLIHQVKLYQFLQKLKRLQRKGGQKDRYCPFITRSQRQSALMPDFHTLGTLCQNPVC